MEGYVKQVSNVDVSEKRVCIALKILSPAYKRKGKSNTAAFSNPISYRTDYLEHKVHTGETDPLWCHKFVCYRWTRRHSFRGRASDNAGQKQSPRYDELY